MRAGAQIEQSFTDNRERLRRAVREIAPTQRIDDARRSVATLRGRDVDDRDADATKPRRTADAARSAQVFVFSDGNFPDVDDVTLERLPIVFVPIGTDEDRRTSPSRGWPCGRNRRIAAQGAGPGASAQLRRRRRARSTRSCSIEGNLVDARRVDGRRSGRSKTSSSRVDDAPDGVWEVRISGTATSCRSTIAPGPCSSRRRERGCSSSRRAIAFLKAALATDEAQSLVRCDDRRRPSFLATDEYRTTAAAGGCTTSSCSIVAGRRRCPRVTRCSSARCRRKPVGGSEPAVAVPQMFDVAQVHPLMQNVAMGEVLMAEATPLVGPSGSQTLVDSSGGAVGGNVAARRLRRRRASASRWSATTARRKRIGRSSTARASSSSCSTRCSTSVAAIARATAGRCAGRSGADWRSMPTARRRRRRNARRRAHCRSQLRRGGERTFYETDDVGPYRVWRGDRLRKSFCRESLRRPRIEPGRRPQTPKLRVGHEEISGQATWEAARLEGWKPFLLLVLALLGGEWYMYGRRGGL